jgi:hypothetical protein
MREQIIDKKSYPEVLVQTDKSALNQLLRIYLGHNGKIEQCLFFVFGVMNCQKDCEMTDFLLPITAVKVFHLTLLKKAIYNLGQNVTFKLDFKFNRDVFLFKAKTSPEKFLTDCVVNELCLIKELETARGKLYNMNVVEFLDRIIKDERCHLNEVEGKLNSIIGKRG